MTPIEKAVQVLRNSSQQFGDWDKLDPVLKEAFIRQAKATINTHEETLFHDLRRNRHDIPNNTRNVLITVKGNDVLGFMSLGGQWISCYGVWINKQDVTGWRELPRRKPYPEPTKQ